jgi:hypothetical protein
MSEARPKVAVCIPYYRTAEGPTLLSAMEMCAYSSRYVDMLPIGSPGSYIEQGRNAAVKMVFETGIDFDYIFWLDSDMIFPPQTLMKLMAWERDIVGCNYRQRTPPYTHVGHYLHTDGESASNDNRLLFEPGLLEMLQMPTGLLLTRMDIYRKMEWPWFDANLRGPRDDVYFCRTARSLGYQVWCDNDLTQVVRHITVQDIPWFDRAQVQIKDYGKTPTHIVRDGAGLLTNTGDEDFKKVAAASRKHFEQLNAAE